MLALAAVAGCSDDGAARAEAEATPRSAVVAMARLEPASQVIQVAASTDDIVAGLHVAEGDRVEAGQPLLTLGRRVLREAELRNAQLDRERVDLQPFELEAQRARLRATEAELAFARAEVANQKGLSEQGFTAGREFDDAQLRVKSVEEQRNEIQARLRQLEASLELERKEADNAVEVARALLEQTVVRAPIRGRILRLLVREGERTGNRPVLRLGDTDTMVAMAEVHASEVRLVHEGQRARFTSSALEKPLDGVVEEIGVIIHMNQVQGDDPSGPSGVRVVQVRVRLEDAQAAAGLTNLEGQIRIFLEPPAAA